MAKADEGDIHALALDIEECIDFDQNDIDWTELKNVLRLALAAEYSVGYEDGYTDAHDRELIFGE